MAEAARARWKRRWPSKRPRRQARSCACPDRVVRDGQVSQNYSAVHTAQIASGLVATFGNGGERGWMESDLPSGPQPENRANPPFLGLLTNFATGSDQPRQRGSTRYAESSRNGLRPAGDWLRRGRVVGCGDGRLARPEGRRRRKGTGARRHHGLVRRLDVDALEPARPARWDRRGS